MTSHLLHYTAPATPRSLLLAFKLGFRTSLKPGLAGGYSWPRDGARRRNRAYGLGARLGGCLGRLVSHEVDPEPRETMAFWEVPGAIRVNLGSLGEGYAGDYDADDPDDELLIRFDAHDLVADEPGMAEEHERRDADASYCTLVPATTPPPVLLRIARAIAEDLAEAPHWKRRCEEWSHVDPAAYA